MWKGTGLVARMQYIRKRRAISSCVTHSVQDSNAVPVGLQCIGTNLNLTSAWVSQ